MRSTWLGAGVVSVVLVLAAAATPAEARPGGGRLLRLQTELGLSDDQVKAIRELHEGERESRHRLARALRETQRALREAILSGADEAGVQARVGEVLQHTAQMVQARAKLLQEMSRILTPEQREKLLQLRRWGRPGASPSTG
jgi:Spy/CpxP family protein refolding chaperone